MTNSLTYLPQVSNVVVLKDGEISEYGGYQDLLAKRGDFSDFVLNYLKEDHEEDVESLSGE